MTKDMTDNEVAIVLLSLRRIFEYKAEKCIARGYVKLADKALRRARALDITIIKLEGGNIHDESASNIK